MKGSYHFSGGVIVPCPDEHPDVERKRKQVPLVKPEYKGVSPTFRALFRPKPSTEIVPELLSEVKTETSFAGPFIAQVRPFLKR